MAQPPFNDPQTGSAKLIGLAKGIPATCLLGSSLLAFNFAQLCSVLLYPFSRVSFYGFNRWAADTWWGWCVLGSKVLNHVELRVSGDKVPPRENAIVVANHQQMPDITFLLVYAQSKERLGDLKWFVKYPIKFVPGIGWGMSFLNCLFIKRNWADDQDAIERTFERFRSNRLAFWIISFVEGTRITEEKLEASRRYADSKGLPPPHHVLIPRTKGFVAAVGGLRDQLDAVYDITIGYPNGIPTLWQFIKGFANRAHFHVRRFPINEVPAEAEQLARWLCDRFSEKDVLLEHFYRHGSFPQEHG